MEKLLKDKVVVITGATRGFGYAIAEAMLKAKAIVVISGRSEDTLTQAIALLGALGMAKGQICDVKEEGQVYALARIPVPLLSHRRSDPSPSQALPVMQLPGLVCLLSVR